MEVRKTWQRRIKEADELRKLSELQILSKANERNAYASKDGGDEQRGKKRDIGQIKDYTMDTTMMIHYVCHGDESYLPG